MVRRALHYVLKVTDRETTMKFYQQILGMKVLRHEEFDRGCEATCNGPYDGRWSKTMVGYGSEDDCFVLELTYNYGIRSYELGSNLQKITLRSTAIKERVMQEEIEFSAAHDGALLITTPSNPAYQFEIYDGDTEDALQKVTLGSSDLQHTGDFWHGILGMHIVEQSDTKLTLDYLDSAKFQLEFTCDGGAVSHGTAEGRIAFSCPAEELQAIQKSAVGNGFKVKTPLISLDTPGKATVHVVILLDPDMHEICFVGDEAFRQLSQTDPMASQLLTKAMEDDKSDEWASKRHKPVA